MLVLCYVFAVFAPETRKEQSRSVSKRAAHSLLFIRGKCDGAFSCLGFVLWFVHIKFEEAARERHVCQVISETHTANYSTTSYTQ